MAQTALNYDGLGPVHQLGAYMPHDGAESQEMSRLGDSALGSAYGLAVLSDDEVQSAHHEYVRTRYLPPLYIITEDLPSLDEPGHSIQEPTCSCPQHPTQLTSMPLPALAENDNASGEDEHQPQPSAVPELPLSAQQGLLMLAGTMPAQVLSQDSLHDNEVDQPALNTTQDLPDCAHPDQGIAPDTSKGSATPNFQTPSFTSFVQSLAKEEGPRLAESEIMPSTHEPTEYPYQVQTAIDSKPYQHSGMSTSDIEQPQFLPCVDRDPNYDNHPHFVAHPAPWQQNYTSHDLPIFSPHHWESGGQASITAFSHSANGAPEQAHGWQEAEEFDQENTQHYENGTSAPHARISSIPRSAPGCGSTGSVGLTETSAERFRHEVSPFREAQAHTSRLNLSIG